MQLEPAGATFPIALGHFERALLSREPVCQQSGQWIPSRLDTADGMKLHSHASITALLLHAGLIDNGELHDRACVTF